MKTEKWLSEQLWDQADQFLVLRPIELSEATCHMQFVEALLGAAASEETSSENPAAGKC